VTDTYNYHPAKPMDEMTLRDYFAAKAMEGLIACPHTDWDGYSDRAEFAYKQADAMLEARKK
jgi:hypothetical protein